MSKLDDIIENQLQWDDPYFGEWGVENAVRYGWDKAKKEILSVLNENERAMEETYGKNCIERIFYLKSDVYKKIEEL